MENLFVPYNQALQLKGMGFDEPCLAKYQKQSESANYQLQLLQRERNCNRLDTAISAPTYQQSFKFFRERHNLIVGNDYGNELYFFWLISKDESYFFDLEDDIFYDTYEQVELASLIKLIEICK